MPTRIELEVRERIEEAVDYVCLDVLVRRRRDRGLPAPAADSAPDRAEYEATVVSLLRRLAAEIEPDAVAPDESVLLAVQVRLARTLPDYWQRFEASAERFLSEMAAVPDVADGASPRGDTGSGSARRGLLTRLFGRG